MQGADYTKDNDSNVIGCPHCKGRSLRKDGWSYYRDSKKQQWYCHSCYRKTLNPDILENSPFAVDRKDPEDMPIEELIDHRQKSYNYKKTSKDNRQLINIDI